MQTQIGKASKSEVAEEHQIMGSVRNGQGAGCLQDMVVAMFKRQRGISIWNSGENR